MKFDAAIHGVDIGKKKSSVTTEQHNFKFGDPEDYKKLSKKQREKLTQEMMGKHKAWNAMEKPMG